MTKKLLRIFGGLLGVETIIGIVVSIHESKKEKTKEINKRNSLYEKYIKRIFDVVLSLTFILFFWWVYVIIAIMVRINLGSPIIFKQERPGEEGKIFILKKFRTMKDAYDKNGNPLPDEERLTEFGEKLRRSSLDELPEVFQILSGKMSIVGVRPLLPEYLERYSPEQARRHEVKPGLTGYAQVNGRNSISWEDRFKLDVWYVDHVSFWTDLKILLKTVWVVIDRSGISSETSVTMEEFKG